MNMQKVLWLDTETTGTDATRHSIIQIAGIIDINGKMVDEFEFKVRPHEDFEIDSESIAIHGFTEEQMLSFPERKETHAALKKVWEKRVDRFDKNDKFTVAGQGIKFDIDMLVNFFYREMDVYLGSYIDFKKRIELLDITRVLQMLGFIKSENVKLETLCKEFGIEIQAHDALSDIRATRVAYYHIIERLKWDK